MSFTVQTTHIYNLVAYRYQSDTPGSTRPNVPKEEWRMYSPNGDRSGLRLAVQISKTDEERISSVIVRVTDQGGNQAGDPIVLENLDLKKFSSPDVMHASPLKAVQGGKQLGLRYIHPLDGPASIQFYKRFQLTFQTVEEAEAVARSVRLVCPCQSSTTSQTQIQRSHQSEQSQVQQKSDMPAPKRRKLDASSAPQPSTSGRNDVSRASTIIKAATSVKEKKQSGLSVPSRPTVPKPVTTNHQSQPIRPSSSISNLLNDPITNLASSFQSISLPPQGPTPQNLTPSFERPSSGTILPPVSSIYPPKEPTSGLSRIDDLFRTHPLRPVPTPSPSSPIHHHLPPISRMPTPPIGTQLQTQSQSQSSDLRPGMLTQRITSPPSSGVASNSAGNPSSIAEQEEPGVPEEPDIYSLSQADLENLVVKVINEPGFDELMGKLDKIFALRAYLRDK
ncbi:hypothetical protein FRC19_001804 [Serendipita sp. 401]|nr:hypothetical protein FRC19_001804 [Serendipita sp. 401]